MNESEKKILHSKSHVKNKQFMGFYKSILF